MKSIQKEQSSREITTVHFIWSLLCSAGLHQVKVFMKELGREKRIPTPPSGTQRILYSTRLHPKAQMPVETEETTTKKVTKTK